MSGKVFQFRAVFFSSSYYLSGLRSPVWLFNLNRVPGNNRICNYAHFLPIQAYIDNSEFIGSSILILKRQYIIAPCWSSWPNIKKIAILIRDIKNSLMLHIQTYKSEYLIKHTQVFLLVVNLGLYSLKHWPLFRIAQ